MIELEQLAAEAEREFDAGKTLPIEQLCQPTYEQKCKELARAMFPTAVIEPSSGGVNIRIYDKPNETRSWYDFNPFASAEDSRALVVWLAEDDTRWGNFYAWFAVEALGVHHNNSPIDSARDMITAPLPVIAEAAWRAIQPAK